VFGKQLKKGRAFSCPYPYPFFQVISSVFSPRPFFLFFICEILSFLDSSDGLYTKSESFYALFFSGGHEPLPLRANPLGRGGAPPFIPPRLGSVFSPSSAWYCFGLAFAHGEGQWVSFALDPPAVSFPPGVRFLPPPLPPCLRKRPFPFLVS